MDNAEEETEAELINSRVQVRPCRIERNAHGYLYPELSPGCTACHACALICPDFVFQVWKYDEPVTHEEAGDEA